MGKPASTTPGSNPDNLPTNNLLQLPPLPAIPDHLPLGPETESAWTDCFAQINTSIARVLGGTTPQYRRNDLKPVSAEDIRRGFAMLQGGETRTVFLGLAYFGMDKEYQQSLGAFWQRPELQPAHLVRFLVMVGALRRGDQHDNRILSYGYWMESLVPVYRRTHPTVGLRELGAAFPAAGLESRRLGGGLLGSYQEQNAPFGLSGDLVWPYWAEHLDVLAKALEPLTVDFMRRYHQRQVRRNAFHARRPRLRQNLVLEDGVGQRLGDPFPRLTTASFRSATPVAGPGAIVRRACVALSLRPGKE